MSPAFIVIIKIEVMGLERIKARLVEEVGVRVYLRAYWGDNCPNVCGTGRAGYHNAKIILLDSPVVGDWSVGGREEDYSDERWPVQCDHCGMPVPPDAIRQVFRERLYNTKSGKPEPGDLYWCTWLPDKFYWDNHQGPQLMAVLPNGHHWNIDSRASNCGRPDNRTHRCWVRHGEPPNITVDKQGDTCPAGAGSIAVSGYHGYLKDGHFLRL